MIPDFRHPLWVLEHIHSEGGPYCTQIESVLYYLKHHYKGCVLNSVYKSVCSRHLIAILIAIICGALRDTGVEFMNFK